MSLATYLLSFSNFFELSFLPSFYTSYNTVGTGLWRSNVLIIIIIIITVSIIVVPVTNDLCGYRRCVNIGPAALFTQAAVDLHPMGIQAATG